MEQLENVELKADSYSEYVHKIGRRSTFILIVMFLMIPFGVTVSSGLSLNYGMILANTAPLAFIMGVIGTVEKITMAPIMGSAAVYVSSATGNVQNMKFPAAVNAIAVAGYEHGSDEGEAVALVAVSVSAITTTLIILAGVIFLAPLVEPIMGNAFVTSAFKYMIPSLMGALASTFIAKNVKISIVPMLSACTAAVLLGAGYTRLQGLLLPLFLVISVSSAYLFFKIGCVNTKEP